MKKIDKKQKTKKETYSIGECCKQLNIKTCNLRNWEKRGLISFKKNIDNNYREFDFGIIQELNEINCLRKLNVSYKDIIKLSKCDLDEAEIIYEGISRKINEEIEILNTNKSTIDDYIENIKEIKILLSSPLMSEIPFFDKALSFDFGAETTDIWFKLGNAVSLFNFDNFKRIHGLIKGIICPENYTYSSKQLVWQYDPTKVYISYLNVFRFEDKINRIYDKEQVKAERQKYEKAIIYMGLKPLKEISVALFLSADYGYFKCWMECEPYKKDINIEKRNDKY